MVAVQCMPSPYSDAIVDSSSSTMTHHHLPTFRSTRRRDVRRICCCSMAIKMPTAARQAFAYVANFFSTSPSSSNVNRAELNGKLDNGSSAVAGSKVMHKTDTISTGDKPSPTDSGGSSDMSEESILNWEPDITEKEIVKRTWSDDFDFLYELGASIYTYIFENNPNTKQLFPAIHAYGDRWKDSKEFRSQALKFVQTLSHVVKNLYHMERLAPYLYKIGEIHVKFAARGFKPEFWNAFLDAMEISLTNKINNMQDVSEEQRAEAILVWRRLAHYVISHMKRGYFDVLKSTGQAG